MCLGETPATRGHSYSLEDFNTGKPHGAACLSGDVLALDLLQEEEKNTQNLYTQLAPTTSDTVDFTDTIDTTSGLGMDTL